MTNVATLHLEELKKELDEYKELSANRLQEIDKLNEEKAQATNEVEKLKMDVSRSIIRQRLVYNSIISRCVIYLKM